MTNEIPLDIDTNNFDEIDKYIDYSDIIRAHTYGPAEMMAAVVVVDGAPVFPQAKEQKFIEVVLRVFSENSFRFGRNAVYVPMHDEKSQGFFFVDCGSSGVAQNVLTKLQKLPFDKKHTFVLNKFADIAAHASVPLEWDEEKALRGLPVSAREFPMTWLLDDDARDQCLIVTKDKLVVQWAGRGEAVHTRNLPDGKVAWTRRGLYLSAMYAPGVTLTGGVGFDLVGRYSHSGVRYCTVSPLETYMCTYSQDPLPAPLPGKPWGPESIGHNVIVWHICTGRILRTFAVPSDKIVWPFFKWSADEKYVAAIAPNKSKVAVYESSTMRQVDKAFYHDIEGITAFAWTPLPEEKKRSAFCPHILAYFVPMRGNDKPAQLVLLNVATKQVLRKRQIFYALSTTIAFAKSGDYVMYTLERTNKFGKLRFTTLEIFRLCEKNYPCDSMDIKTPLCCAELAPVGDYLATITWEGTYNDIPNGCKVQDGAQGHMVIGFYRISTGGCADVAGSLRTLAQFDKKSCNRISWSPKGRFVVFCGIRDVVGKLEFYDVNGRALFDYQEETELEETIEEHVVNTRMAVPSVMLLSQRDHLGVDSVGWDPTGRYFVSCTTNQSRVPTDQGYNLWNFYGKLLLKKSCDVLRQFEWRPRPQSVLSKSAIDKIKSNMEEYISNVAEQDIKNTMALQKKMDEKKDLLFSSFINMRSEALKAIVAIEEKKIVLVQ